ncbi:uncharacterized protein LOC129731095 [Wyeomyia smithii]|uniref:uncharacterized protein LOC129731095 n=1 Tax=Wyeomyia smithii TaxID=174621 RepID=UPI002467F8C1|nr:uncharacterized protein LOC129731095 [Wyeomyia smithii]
MGNNYKCTVKLAHSRLGNNQFNDYPIAWNDHPICDMMKSKYRDYQYIFLNHSNFPQVSETGLCPFPAGTYWFKNTVFPSNVVPEFIPEGYWRITFLYSGAGNVSASLYARVKHLLV